MRRVSKIAVCLFCAQLLLPASVPAQAEKEHSRPKLVVVLVVDQLRADYLEKYSEHWTGGDRKSTRLNSSHSQISYAVFCLKKKRPARSRWVWHRNRSC